MVETTGIPRVYGLRKNAWTFFSTCMLAILFVGNFGCCKAFAAGFTVGTRMVTATDTLVRSSPSLSAAIVGSHQAGALGTITAGPVSANGITWWQVNYEAAPDGWSPVSALALPYFPPPESNQGWRSLVTRNQTPTSAQKVEIASKTGLHWDALKFAYDYSQSFTTGTTSLVVIRHGWIAGEWGSTSAYGVASVTKSLTGLAMAKLFDLSNAGALRTTIGPEDDAYRYLPPAWDNNDPRKRNIQIKHLMTMSSGLEPDDSPHPVETYLDFLRDMPVRVPPETEWSYSSPPVDLLSMALQEVSGKTLRNFFSQYIASPIGIPSIPWETFDIYTRGAAGVSISARNLARLGYLVLMNGAWDSGTGQRQIISRQQIALLRQWPAFLDDVIFRTTPGSPFRVDSDSPEHYGHLWWTNLTGTALGQIVPADAYYAHGYKETLLIVVPSLNMVIVRFGPRPVSLPEFRRAFMSRIMAAVEPGTDQEVVSFTLINADTDRPIAGFDPLPQSAVLNLATLPTRRLNIRANTDPATVGSVRFALDGNANFRTESTPPYALAGDSSGDYVPWTPSNGTHRLTATPYTQAGARGTSGTPLNLTFTVTNNSSTVVSQP